MGEAIFEVVVKQCTYLIAAFARLDCSDCV